MMSDFIKDTLQKINKSLAKEGASPEVHDLLLILKAELLASQRGNSTMLAAISLVYIECMSESQKLTTAATELTRSFNDLKTSVNQGKAQMKHFGGVVQNFKCQENRLYSTIEGMHKAMQSAKQKNRLYSTIEGMHKAMQSAKQKYGED